MLSKSLDDYIEVVLRIGHKEYILCTLKKGEIPQCRMNHMFQGKTHLTLFIRGKGVVQLSGEILPELMNIRKVTPSYRDFSY